VLAVRAPRLRNLCRALDDLTQLAPWSSRSRRCAAYQALANIQEVAGPGDRGQALRLRPVSGRGSRIFGRTCHSQEPRGGAHARRRSATGGDVGAQFREAVGTGCAPSRERISPPCPLSRGPEVARLYRLNERTLRRWIVKGAVHSGRAHQPDPPARGRGPEAGPGDRTGVDTLKPSGLSGGRARAASWARR
jgi:hypothetical protein